ncbi:hypothetical protein CDV55_105531 [Aspergillus turcosus]|nr:hypothetical protein CDV55_105531 [Aspergillus turcosus]
MPSFFRSLALHALLTGALVAQVTNAYPQPALARSQEYDSITGEPVAIVPSVEVDGDLYKRSNPLSIAQEPDRSYNCPATNNYGETSYTSGQLKAAFIRAAQYANDGQQIGDRNYPHTFGNGENLPFPCGRSTMEFPLDRDSPGSVYSGQSVRTLPDRIVFEFKDGKKDAKAKFCGHVVTGRRNIDLDTDPVIEEAPAVKGGAKVLGQISSSAEAAKKKRIANAEAAFEAAVKAEFLIDDLGHADKGKGEQGSA